MGVPLLLVITSSAYEKGLHPVGGRDHEGLHVAVTMKAHHDNLYLSYPSGPHPDPPR